MTATSKVLHKVAVTLVSTTDDETLSDIGIDPLDWIELIVVFKSATSKCRRLTVGHSGVEFVESIDPVSRSSQHEFTDLNRQIMDFQY